MTDVISLMELLTALPKLANATTTANAINVPATAYSRRLNTQLSENRFLIPARFILSLRMQQHRLKPVIIAMAQSLKGRESKSAIRISERWNSPGFPAGRIRGWAVSIWMEVLAPVQPVIPVIPFLSEKRANLRPVRPVTWVLIILNGKCIPHQNMACAIY